MDLYGCRWLVGWGTSEQVRVRVVLHGRTSPFSLTFSSSCKPVSAQSSNFVLTDGVLATLTLYGEYHFARRVFPLYRH